ncbi:MAG: S1C family serine protease, partial [Phycisphaerae bacterium]|nr:S1C family serine protease [Phycisphaerae bacterium]
IAQVVEDSPAAKGDVQANDILHMVNGQLIINRHQFTTLIHSMAIGDEVLLAVIREGKAKVLQVKLGKRARNSAPVRIQLGGGRINGGPAGRELAPADWERIRAQLGGKLGGEIRRAVEDALIKEGVVDQLAEEGVDPRLLDEALGGIEDGVLRSESREIHDADGKTIGNITIIRRGAVIVDDSESSTKQPERDRREKP